MAAEPRLDDSAVFPWRLGDLVEARVLAISAEGLLLQLPGQLLPALLPKQNAPLECRLGDDLAELRVSELDATDGESASQVVPREAYREDQPPSSLSSFSAFQSRLGLGFGDGAAGALACEGWEAAPFFCDEEGEWEPVGSRLAGGRGKGLGRGSGRLGSGAVSSGYAGSPAFSSGDSPHLAFSGAGPSWAELNPRPCESPVDELPPGPVYSKDEMLKIRPFCVGRAEGDEASPGFLAMEVDEPATERPPGPPIGERQEQPTQMLTTSPTPEEELGATLLQTVISGQLPPSWWRRCGVESKREALLGALRAGRMHAVFAMQPESEQFREELGCIEMTEGFLKEAMRLMCADSEESASSAASTPVGWPKPVVRKTPLGTAAALAWSSRGTAATPPAAAAIAWLLEQGAPADELLPESPGAEHLAARLRGLRLLGELGPATAALSPGACATVAGCLRDPEAKGRRAAADALGRLGPPAAANAPRAIPRMVRLMQTEPDPQTREAVAKALGRMGPQALAAVGGSGGLGHKDPEVRGLAALAVGEAGEGAECEYGEILVTWLQPAQAFASVAAGGQIKGGSGSGSSHSEVSAPLRARAAQSLGLMGGAAGPDAAPVLAVCLASDPDQHVREALAVALGRLGSAEGLPGASAVARAALSAALD
ncbi:unnamed protein product, partial [Polarella glacialis]